MANKTSLTQGVKKSLDCRKRTGFLLEYFLFIDQDIYFEHDVSPLLMYAALLKLENPAQISAYL